MAFIMNMKNLLIKILHDIGYSVYHSFFRVIGYIIVFLVVGFFAQSCAKAATITDNFRTISETNLTFLKDIYERTNYSNYIITSDYNNYSSYYLCLTNDVIDTSDVKNLTTRCDELYHYRNTSNNYNLEKLNDNSLTIQNSIYYTNSAKTIESEKRLQVYCNIIVLFLCLILFVYYIKEYYL